MRKKTSSPLLIGIYKGEGRILIVPCVRHIGGFYVNSHNTLSIDYFSDNKLIGQSIIDVIKYIKNSPEDASTPYDREKNPVWKENTKYKSKTSFYKNNHYVNIQIFEDRNYDVYSLCTKLLVPRNGPNVEEENNIEKKLNLYYNIIM